MVSLAMTWNDTPGSAILKRRQFEDVPAFDFLMHQQGPFFSGKSVGDLDSVPGYYGATASVKFVQNAQAMKQIRKARAAHNIQKYGVLATPFEKRLEALRSSVMFAPKAPRAPNVSKARGYAFKYAGEVGARFGAREIDRLSVLPVLKKILAHNKGGRVVDLPHRQRQNGAIIPRDPIAGVQADGALPPASD
jgi:hypothetical protein